MKRQPQRPTPPPPQTDYVLSWIDFVIGHAANDPALLRRTRDPAAFGWLRETAADTHAESLGLLLQLACENPEDFERMFGPTFTSDMAAGEVHPFTERGLGFINSVFRNGIMDDWELYLKHTDIGYVVVNEDAASLADQRFNWEIAPGALLNRVGGRRQAPGEADVDALVQAQMEATPSPTFG